MFFVYRYYNKYTKVKQVQLNFYLQHIENL